MRQVENFKTPMNLDSSKSDISMIRYLSSAFNRLKILVIFVVIQ